MFQNFSRDPFFAILANNREIAKVSSFKVVFRILITLQDLYFKTTYFVKSVFLSKMQGHENGNLPDDTKNYSEYFFNFIIQWRILLCNSYWNSFSWNKHKYKIDGPSCFSTGSFAYWVCVCVSVCDWVCWCVCVCVCGCSVDEVTEILRIFPMGKVSLWQIQNYFILLLQNLIQKKFMVEFFILNIFRVSMRIFLSSVYVFANL